MALERFRKFEKDTSVEIGSSEFGFLRRQLGKILGEKGEVEEPGSFKEKMAKGLFFLLTKAELPPGSYTNLVYYTSIDRKSYSINVQISTDLLGSHSGELGDKPVFKINIGYDELATGYYIGKILEESTFFEIDQYRNVAGRRNLLPNDVRELISFLKKIK